MLNHSKYFVQGDFIVRDLLPQTIFKNMFTRYLMHWFYSCFIKSVLLIDRFIRRRHKREYKYDIILCGIFKNEASFLKEWISYHLVLGIKHFVLYNNNSTDNFREVLQQYISDGTVELIDWPYEQGQMSAYKDCYEKNKGNTNWITFIDIDEFICPLYVDDLSVWLSNFRKFPGVAVYWKQFGSQGLINHDHNKLVIEQYEQCWPRPSNFTKMFCNMDYPIEAFDNMHNISSIVAKFSIPPINQYKNIIAFGINKVSKGPLENKIQINHYWGKAYDCFVENKIKRTDAYYENGQGMAEIREKLLKSHESMCSTKDYNIQRFLLLTKLKMLCKI